MFCLKAYYTNTYILVAVGIQYPIEHRQTSKNEPRSRHEVHKYEH